MIVQLPIFSIMGNPQSKVEQREVIIAQGGANDAQQSNFEIKMAQYGIAMISIMLLALTVCFCILCVKCGKGAQKWMRKQISTVLVLGAADKATQEAKVPTVHAYPV